MSDTRFDFVDVQDARGSQARAYATRGGSGLSADALAAMRPHLVNLRSGVFSSKGEFSSTPKDVDLIFREHLPRALAAVSGGGKLKLLFYAHGGLVSEEGGLLAAHRHIEWWLRNGVYPVYFIWETGFFETIAQLVKRAFGGERALTRDLADYTSDPLIEVAARLLQGPRIWGGMKWSAERASREGGAAHYVAQKLAAFCANNADRVELHAVGHSAGAIFNAHFLPACFTLGVPVFNTLQLLAPAIRIDAFKEQLMAGVMRGELASSVCVFTMKRDYERDDNCARVYRKSLLYLISNALEDDSRMPILGLEESLRDDEEVEAFFGLKGAAGRGEVVWSKSDADSGRSASRSDTHGGFDEDAPTMNSLLRRVLALDDTAPIDAFPGNSRAIRREWADEGDLPPDWFASARPMGATLPVTQPSSAGFVPDGASTTAAGAASSTGLASGGRRIALCIGIDAYPNPADQLLCCVDDARAWANELMARGFVTKLLLDADATRAAIDAALRELVSQARPGDVMVVQYAGHGTHVKDLEHDEDDGRDEALCPVDYASGALYIDDDIADVLRSLPDGVNLTFFMDCCHSATNTRFAGSVQSASMRASDGVKYRYIKPTEALQQAHARYRGTLRHQTRGPATAAAMRHVKFAACHDGELAAEFDGSGAFTRHALQVLRRRESGVSNQAFFQTVVAAFGDRARQNPFLDCADASRGLPLLEPIGDRGPVVGEPSSEATVQRSLVSAVVALSQAVDVLSNSRSR